jgi:uncharacterized Zn-binding protein involved in type VI secretion
VSAEAAARLGDEIAHGFGLAAMIAGAVVGAVVGVAIVAATAATGGLAAVIIAGCVAGGGLAMGQIASGLKTIFNLPEPTSGILAMGSPNVLTNIRPAARAVLDFAAGCTGIPINHFPMMAPVPLAEGSSTVLINGMPASRLKSKLVCGAHVKSGSPDVVIGGETVQVLPVFDLEGWFKTGLEILGMGALFAGGVFAALAGVAALGTFGAVLGVGYVAFEGLGMLGDAIGPGYRDLFQGIASMGLLLTGPKLAGGRNTPRSAQVNVKPKGKPDWLRRVEEGNEFNRSQAPRYPHNEVMLDRPIGAKGYPRLDSYDPVRGEIVSRKNTQLSSVQEATAKSYLDELSARYPSGSTIADVPTQQVGSGHGNAGLGGTRLTGTQILEVPPQTSPVPQSVLDHAQDLGIIIRDSNGRIYP